MNISASFWGLKMNEKCPNVLIKVAALTSSIVLVTAFIVYRAEAIAWLVNLAEPTAPIANHESTLGMADPVRSPTENQSQYAAPHDAAPPNPTFIGSSKSYVIVSEVPKKAGASPSATSQPASSPR